MAMMFQRAPPEVAGFGSITSTSGLARSSKLVMFFGLPGRTIRVTTELVTMPLYWFWFQSEPTMPASTSRVMSGSSENIDDVGRLARLDRAALVTGRSERVREIDVLRRRTSS